MTSIYDVSKVYEQQETQQDKDDVLRAFIDLAVQHPEQLAPVASSFLERMVGSNEPDCEHAASLFEYLVLSTTHELSLPLVTRLIKTAARGVGDPSAPIHAFWSGIEMGRLSLTNAELFDLSVDCMKKSDPSAQTGAVAQLLSIDKIYDSRKKAERLSSFVNYAALHSLEGGDNHQQALAFVNLLLSQDETMAVPLTAAVLSKKWEHSPAHFNLLCCSVAYAQENNREWVVSKGNHSFKPDAELLFDGMQSYIDYGTMDQAETASAFISQFFKAFIPHHGLSLLQSCWRALEKGCGGSEPIPLLFLWSSLAVAHKDKGSSLLAKSQIEILSEREDEPSQIVTAHAIGWLLARDARQFEALVPALVQRLSHEKEAVRFAAFESCQRGMASSPDVITDPEYLALCAVVKREIQSSASTGALLVETPVRPNENAQNSKHAFLAAVERYSP